MDQTPDYIVLEETCRKKLRIEARLKAIKYYEKFINFNSNRLLFHCLTEIRRKGKKNSRKRLGNKEENSPMKIMDIKPKKWKEEGIFELSNRD